MKRIQDEFRRILIVGLLALSTPTFAQKVGGSVSRIGDATHLEFSGKSDWDYETEFGANNTLKLTVPAFADKTLVDLKSWSDKHIKKIEVDTEGPDKKYIVKFHFTSNKVEMFDYLTDEPSRLILDFYQKAEVKKTKPVAKKKAKASKKQASSSLPEKKILPEGVYKKLDRGPASTELLSVNPVEINMTEREKKDFYPKTGIFDAGDPNFSRFKMSDSDVKEDAIIASENNIYIKFPYLQLTTDVFQDLMSERPIYEIKPKDTKENKEARLLQGLSDKKRYASFEKVYEYFLDNYPQSNYLQIVHNIAAEAQIDRYLEPLESTIDEEKQKLERRQAYNKFRGILKLTLIKFPDSPLDKRNRLLLGFSALRQEDSLEALRSFDAFLKKYPLADEKYQVNLGRSEAFLLLKKPEEATRVLASLENKATKKDVAVEAAYRTGDVQMEFEKYPMAGKLYEKQIAKYPEYKSVFPNALYNLSESYFWQKKYKKSLDHFVGFLKFYPSHEHAGYALTRIGELLDILGADQRKTMGAFVEAYFRYPNNAGASVARVRMLSRALRNMKPKQKRIALAEIQQIQENSKLPGIYEFSTLVVSDGLSRGEEYKESLRRLEEFYRDNPRTDKFEVFKKRILSNIAEILKSKVDDKQYIETLDYYGKYMPTWLKQSDRIDTDYFKAYSYEMSGVYDEAEKLYTNVERRLLKIAGTREEKERRVLEHLPTVDSIRLRLGAVALEQKKIRKAYGYIKKTNNQLSDKEKVEKVKIGAEVAERSGDLISAISYLQKLIVGWKGEEALLAEPLIKLGQLYLQTNNVKKAAEYVERLNDMEKVAVAEEIQPDVLKLKADTLLAQGKEEAAVKNYLELLDKYETQRPLASVRYQAGDIKFQSGDIKGAERIWSRLNNEKNGHYARLASEKLSQAEWNDDYKKYIDRIPAAKELK